MAKRRKLLSAQSPEHLHRLRLQRAGAYSRRAPRQDVQVLGRANWGRSQSWLPARELGIIRRPVEIHKAGVLENAAAGIDPRIEQVRFGIRQVRVSKDGIVARLADGRATRVPLARSCRLSQTTPSLRGDFRIIGGGQGVPWPEVDEDPSVEGFLQGVAAPLPRRVALAGRAPARPVGGRQHRPIKIPAD
jgi:hypothetical protein